MDATHAVVFLHRPIITFFWFEILSPTHCSQTTLIYFLSIISRDEDEKGKGYCLKLIFWTKYDFGFYKHVTFQNCF